MNKKKILAIILATIGILFIILGIFNLNKNKIMTTECKYVVETPSEKKSYSLLTIDFSKDKIKKLIIESNLYGEDEFIDGKKNESEGRKLFEKKYDEFKKISSEIETDGTTFEVSLNNDLLKYITTINYDKVKNTDNGLNSLKNKNKTEIIKYFENLNYVCNK